MWLSRWNGAVPRGIVGIMRILILVFGLLAAPALAQNLMSAQEFDNYTQGKTFTYASTSGPYGREQYLPNRRVRWSFLDGECHAGEWYEAAGLICFVYDIEPEPQCWSFERGDTGLIARFENDALLNELYEVEQSRAPLSCPGPDVGV